MLTKERTSEKKRVKATITPSDRELVEVIQSQFEAYRAGGHWLCNCGEKIPHHGSFMGLGKVPMRTKCPREDCGCFVERFITTNPQSFDSPEFNEIYRRYEKKIERSCEKFNGIEQDTMGEMNHRFLLSVMAYNGSFEFSTFVWGNIRRRFEDFERKNSRACKSNPVQCPLCGRMTGAITRVHLMNTKTRPKEGFVGHGVLHEKVIADIGVEKFAKMADDVYNDNQYKWEGHNYSRKQKKLVSFMITDAYRQVYPNYTYYPMSISNVSISGADPDTKIDYIDMLRDKKQSTIKTSGYYLSGSGKLVSRESDDSMFIPFELDDREIDIAKDFATKVTPYLHKKMIRNRTRKTFQNTADQEGLQSFLEHILPYVAQGYLAPDLHFLGYPQDEIEFWLAKIKKSREIKDRYHVRKRRKKSVV